MTKINEFTIRSRVIDSILTYTESKKNVTLNWIIGIIQDESCWKSSKEALIDIFNELRPRHGTEIRFKQLEEKCKELGIL